MSTVSIITEIPFLAQVAKMEDYSEEHFIVKISGMPYTATCEDVAKFLAGLDIKGGRKNGVHVTRDESGGISIFF